MGRGWRRLGDLRVIGNGVDRELFYGIGIKHRIGQTMNVQHCKRFRSHVLPMLRARGYFLVDSFIGIGLRGRRTRAH